MPSPWRPYSVGHKVLVYIFGLVEAVLSVTGTLIWLRKRRAMGVDMASLAIQVFGGMGYVEETGVAQLLRDARIAPIYEGTNGIQAVDLTCRKLDADAHWRDLVDEIEVFVPQLYDTLAWREDFQTMVTALRQAGETVAAMTKMERTHIATNFLRLCGVVISAYLLSRQVKAAIDAQTHAGRDARLLEARFALAEFYCREMSHVAYGLVQAIVDPRSTLASEHVTLELLI